MQKIYNKGGKYVYDSGLRKGEDSRNQFIVQMKPRLTSKILKMEETSSHFQYNQSVCQTWRRLMFIENVEDR